MASRLRFRSGVVFPAAGLLPAVEFPGAGEPDWETRDAGLSEDLRVEGLGRLRFLLDFRRAAIAFSGLHEPSWKESITTQNPNNRTTRWREYREGAKRLNLNVPVLSAKTATTALCSGQAAKKSPAASIQVAQTPIFD